VVGGEGGLLPDWSSCVPHEMIAVAGVQLVRFRNVVVDSPETLKTHYILTHIYIYSCIYRHNFYGLHILVLHNITLYIGYTYNITIKIYNQCDLTKNYHKDNISLNYCITELQ